MGLAFAGRSNDSWRGFKTPDAVSFLTLPLNNPLRELDQHISVKNLVGINGQSTLVAATPEDLGQLMHQLVAFLFVARHHLVIDRRQFRDLAGELFVQKLPSPC